MLTSSFYGYRDTPNGPLIIKKRINNILSWQPEPFERIIQGRGLRNIKKRVKYNRSQRKYVYTPSEEYKEYITLLGVREYKLKYRKDGARVQSL